MFRKKQPPEPPARAPHPDPRTEVKLQRVISLKRAADRDEQLLDEYRDQVSAVQQVRSKHPTGDGHASRGRQIDDLNREVKRLNAETSGLHEQIAKLTGELDDTDLSYL